MGTLHGMTASFQRKWSDEQQEACVSAKLDRQGTAARVREMAMAGELTTRDGTKLPAFSPPISTIAGWVEKEKKARLGRNASNLAQLPHRDATEALRVRLVSAVDYKLREIDRKLKRDESSVSFEELRQAARAIREAQALPGRNDPRSPAPGAKTNGTQHGGQTRGGMAGELLKAHRAGEGSTASETPTETQTTKDNSNATERSAVDDGAEEGQEDGAPGSLARGLAARSLSPA